MESENVSQGSWVSIYSLASLLIPRVIYYNDMHRRIIALAIDPDMLELLLQYTREVHVCYGFVTEYKNILRGALSMVP